ncbi:MAG: ArnT family glycosyltransferase [Thermodesulfobacteriota bacterium]
MRSLRGDSRYQALFLAAFAGYVILVLPFTREMPMHEEVIHLRDTASWSSALAYFCHPPLYALMARSSRSVFGEGFRSLYLIGILSALVNIYLVGRIVDAVASGLPQRRRRLAVLSGMWAVVLMPVFVHGSLLLEMEPTVLTPLCLLALWYYIRHGGGPTPMPARFYVTTGILFGLAMWAKYFITPFLLIGAIFVYEATTGGRFARAARNTLIILASALALFVPTYLLYSHLFIKGMNSFTFLFFNKPQEGVPILLSSRILFSMGTKLAAFTFWFSPFFIALFLYLSAGLVARWKDAGRERLLLISIGAIFFFYLFMHPYPFGESKYFYPIFPLLAVVTVKLFIDRGITLPPLRYVVLVPVCAVVIYFVLGDPLYRTLELYRNRMAPRVLLYIGLYAAVNLVLFGSLAAVLLRAVGRRRDALCSALVYLAVGASLSLFAHQAAGGYQTKIQYGESGAGETVDFVRSAIPAQSSVILPGDIGFYSGVHFSRTGATMAEFPGPGWDWIVQRKVNILRLAPGELAALGNGYALVREIGSYEIYRKKGRLSYNR